MMPVAPLLRIIRQNLRRNLKHFILSAFGIVVGIASFVFFLGLSGGVRKVVLGDIFPIDRVEVIAPKTTLTGVRVVLDDAVVATLKARPEVEAVFPKMKLAFPSKGYGELFGARPRFPLGGFCDGIDPALVANDKHTAAFKDWEAEDAQKPRIACDPGERPTEEWEHQCPPELGETQAALKAEKKKKPDEQDPEEIVRLEELVVELEKKKDQCPADYYCGWDKQCHHRVPVLISRTMVELYNGSFAPSHGLKRIGTVAEAAMQDLLKKMKFKIELGRAHIEGTKMKLHDKLDCAEAMLLTVNNKAIPIGMTVPIGYIRRWNQRYLGPDAPTSYSSIIVDLKSKDDVAGFVSWVKKSGYEQEESYAENFALVITIVTLLFILISLVIIGISAVNIAHTFFMLISDRKREIGILRAVGASRSDVRKIILGEAALIGLLGGALGVSIGVAAAKVIDFASKRFVPDFPFKPTTYFLFTPTLLLGALGFAVAFCVVGAYLPARKAARMQPAQALTA